MRKCTQRATRGAAWISLLLAAGLAGTGCVRKGDNRLVYSRGANPAPLVKAPKAGTYALYPEDAAEPRYSIFLSAGDEYGFRKREDDAIVAVARDKEIELGDRFVPSYYWTLKKNDK